MISYIKGTVIDIEEDILIMEANQIGYNIRIPLSSTQLLPSIGSETKIFTFMHVREDAISLFGFCTKDELEVFKLLITVNGIGPKGALGILSSIPVDELRFAVLSEDIKTLSKAPGIGVKTAKRLAMELKDKFKLEEAFEQKLQNTGEFPDVTLAGDAKNEAIQALTALGYSAAEALRAVKQVTVTETMDVEMILREALKKISSF